MNLLTDLGNKTTTLVGDDDSDKILELRFLNNGSLPVEFSGFRMSVSILKNGVEVISKVLPPENVEYESTDQEVLDSIGLDELLLGSLYEILVQVENGGERWELQNTFTLPLYEKPYPSWIWNEENQVWDSPVPHPSDGPFYMWDEESLSWIPDTSI